MQLYEAYTSLAEETLCQPNWESWLVTARTVACDAFASASQNAQVLIPNDYGEFYDVATPLVYWASTASYFNAPCQDLNTWPDVLNAEFDQFLIFYNPVVDGVISGDFDTIRSVREEIQRLYAFYAELLSLGLSTEADQLADMKIRPLLSALRNKAYSLCHQDKDHYFLTKMTYSGFLAGTDVLPIDKAAPITEQLLFADFDDDDIFRDLQYCASCLDVTYMVDDQEWQNTSLGGGENPGEETASSQIYISEFGVGRLVFGCDIRRLVCFPPSLNANDSLRFEFEGVVVQTLGPTSDASLLAQDVEISIESLMAAAEATIGPNQDYLLEIWRDRSECEVALFGENSVKLFELRVRTGT